jgi:hypothetical protein
MTRINWERLAALAGIAFVVLYVAAFAPGIEVGKSDREILDYYADSGNRAKEVVAFFLIAGAALAFGVFAGALRSLIARAEQETAMLAALTWAGGTACAVLVLASLAGLGRLSGGGVADARDCLHQLPRPRGLGARRQRRPCIRPPHCDGGGNRCDAVNV